MCCGLQEMFRGGGAGQTQAAPHQTARGTRQTGHHTGLSLSLCNYICPKPVALIFTAARLFRKHRLRSNGTLQLLVTALQCVPKLSGPFCEFVP